jgi:hypothetical protein
MDCLRRTHKEQREHRAVRVGGGGAALARQAAGAVPAAAVVPRLAAATRVALGAIALHGVGAAPLLLAPML